MKVAVIMNARAGSIGAAHAEERARSIREAFAAAGVESVIHACPGPELTPTARKAAASGVDAVVAAGGDGTVSAVASALVGGDVPLAVLPLGTLNHFARDLGMPDDLAEATRAIADGDRGRVDVGQVNGRTFVNNSSIGLYPLVVQARDAEQRATGHSKYRAMLTAAWRVLRRFPLVTVHVTSDAGVVLTRAPFVFVGNNAYEVSPLALGQRRALDRGHLSLYTMRCHSRLKLFWLTLRAIFQRLDQVEDLVTHDAGEISIDLPKRRVPVALDGEVVTMSSPLRYSVRAGELLVVRPRAAETAGEAAA
ncbi:MAG TPA: diacylglycerol kinase family protein [Kofleriaceae bacterium]|nr:diacylglycerol kinase family protein [Kofleriaceae bacterium]